jgi:hypothetical protein
MKTGSDIQFETITTSMGNVQLSNTIGGYIWDSGSSSSPVPYEYKGSPPGISVIQPTIDIREVVQYSKEPMEGIKMSIPKSKRGLFEVILVDSKKEEVILDVNIIANTPEDALLTSGASEKIKEKKLKVADVDKIIMLKGLVRKTKTVKDGKVVIMDDTDEN